MKRILGLDLGVKTLGIAVSDALGLAAHGYENFRFSEKAYQQAIAHTLEILNKEKIDEVALGLALNMNGTESDSSQAARKFKEELLKHNPNLKIELIDERMSTIQATRLLLEADLSRAKRKKVIDMTSAVMILETYLRKKENAV